MGNIYNKKGRKLSPYVDCVGYYQIVLTKDKKTYHVRLHRHIYEAFYGKIPKGMVINHKNGNKLDNSIQNLEVVTNSENTKHGYDMGLYHSKKRSIPVKVYDQQGQYIKTYKSIREVSSCLGINRKILSQILFNNKRNNYKYIFEPILDTKDQTTIQRVSTIYTVESNRVEYT